jgi:hypothetical protein
MCKFNIRIIFLVLSFVSCNKKNAHPNNQFSNNAVKKYFSVKYIGDSIIFKNQDKILHKDFNQKKYSRDSSFTNAIYTHDNKNNTIVFFNYSRGINLISLEGKKTINKTLPNKMYSKSFGDSIILNKKRILHVSKLYSIIYDDKLNCLFLPYEFIVEKYNYKYEQILEANYSLNKDTLITKIRYLDSFHKEKDTVFKFNLYNLPDSADL